MCFESVILASGSVKFVSQFVNFTENPQLINSCNRYRLKCLRGLSGTEKIPQRPFATKILPNFQVNFLVRFTSKPLSYRVVPSNRSENSLVLFVRLLGLGFFFGSG